MNREKTSSHSFLPFAQGKKQGGRCHGIMLPQKGVVATSDSMCAKTHEIMVYEPHQTRDDGSVNS